ncbi:hypothetical protein RJ492_002541 [Pluralibacter gergoviae]|uniref:Lipoprotein n=2 Tax=Pluralibacter gergoviae TaxID=61647 RepID=A0AAI9DJ83_PLUGE|nr:hypothetical protein [Pluralibacter gergoviae]AVR04786.1 hypothetical protein A8H26_19850 [Pluralibacter gergoviae]EKT9638649.1 hypothetical protein [Pluralibacter gergoviae]EKV0914905.1 hypothetical protein [Pluralibacter gergoviae]EKV3542531.1 hypothetical protein [Pluralibacter gergoviae]EKV6245504.1 hypothetical protein [Pluralibacter gergoviae]
MKKAILTAAALSSLMGCGASISAEEAHIGDQQAWESRQQAALQKRIDSINFATANLGDEPKKYKKRVKKAIRFVLDDPDSAKFSGFTPPRKEVLADRGKLIYGYATCVYVNHKTPSGSETGDVLYWVFMRDNEVLRIKNTQNPGGRVIFPGRNIRCD